MIRTFFYSSVLLLVLTGCQTGSELQRMSNSGMEAFSCGQISSAFAAYEGDRQSAEALRVLVEMMGANYASIINSGAGSVDGFYQRAKASANIALVLKGCQPL